MKALFFETRLCRVSMIFEPVLPGGSPHGKVKKSPEGAFPWLPDIGIPIIQHWLNNVYT
jgi:hypothetical protein